MFSEFAVRDPTVCSLRSLSTERATDIASAVAAEREGV